MRGDLSAAATGGAPGGRGPLTRKARATIAFGAVLIVASGAMFVVALGFPAGRLGEPGPGIWPQIVLVLIALMSAAMIGREVYRAVRGAGGASARGHVVEQADGGEPAEEAAAPGEADPADRLVVSRHTAIVAPLLLGYLLLLPYAGYYVSTPLLIAVVLRVLGIRSLIAVAALAAGATLFVYVLFEQIVAMPFPKGEWLGA